MAFHCFPGLPDKMVHDSYHVALIRVSKVCVQLLAGSLNHTATETFGTVTHTEPHAIHPCLSESADADSVGQA
jgi:hypothetical protein